MSEYKGEIGPVLALETALSEKDVKALNDYIAKIAAPTPEGEPVAIVDDCFENRICWLKEVRHLAQLYTHPAPSDELVKAVLDERFGVCATAIRDVCELDADNPTDPSTICINVETLERLIDEALRAALDKVK